MYLSFKKKEKKKLLLLSVLPKDAKKNTICALGHFIILDTYQLI